MLLVQLLYTAPLRVIHSLSVTTVYSTNPISISLFMCYFLANLIHRYCVIRANFVLCIKIIKNCTGTN